MSADKLGATTGERDRLHNPGIQHGKYEASKPLTVKTCGVAAVGETPSLTGEFVGETHGVLERAQAHPPGNQHQKGPICLWVSGKVTESLLRAQQVALFLLRPLSHVQHHHTGMWFAPPW